MCAHFIMLIVFEGHYSMQTSKVIGHFFNASFLTRFEAKLYGIILHLLLNIHVDLRDFAILVVASHGEFARDCVNARMIVDL